MRPAEEVLTQVFIEQQLRVKQAWLLHQSRWNFVQHRRSNPAHTRWKRRRAAGRH